MFSPKVLFELGIRLQRVVICADDVDTISADVGELSAAHDYVFTSGGVGPTHDDVTMEALARAFSQPIERNERLVDLLTNYFGERLKPDHLVMADVPAGTVLLWKDGVDWPLVRVGNVFVLPGLPKVFRMKMALVRAHLKPGTPFVSKQVKTDLDEGTIAPVLHSLVEQYPDVSVGSYPRWESGESTLIIAFDGTSPDRVDQAAQALQDALAQARASGIGQYLSFDDAA